MGGHPLVSYCFRVSCTTLSRLISLTGRSLTFSEMCEYGYPCPGSQTVSSQDVMKSVYFVSNQEWENIKRDKSFDYVVVGSSFCALAFTKRMLDVNRNAKILILERGEYFHPEHVQNLHPVYTETLGGTSETFHWRLTEETHNGKYIKWQHGMNNFFGGRSSFWSGWCPQPTKDEMRDWPEKVKDKVIEYFQDAKKLLNVIPANEIGAGSSNRIFGELQDTLVDKLWPSELKNITRVEHAQLAVGAKMYRNEDFLKYSAAGPLLGLLLWYTKYMKKGQALRIKTNCLVKKIIHESGKAVKLQTDKGELELGDAKLILAMGTLPPTTLMLNSFPDLALFGKHFTAHFISSIIARIPATSPNMKSTYYNLIQENREKGKLEIAAVYVAGKNSEYNRQFHIQLSAIIDSTPLDNVYDTMRHLPDVVAAPTLEQLWSSKDPPHVVFVCASLGELDNENDKNWFRLNGDKDITCNATLQVVANHKDNALWETMDDTTYAVLKKLDPDGLLEYWHADTSSWKKERPPREQIRVPGLVHEASTMWIGDNKSAPVGLDYRFHGVENVYLTGGALWPTGGSWNPTCAMTAMAMDLADQLNNKE